MTIAKEFVYDGLSEVERGIEIEQKSEGIGNT